MRIVVAGDKRREDWTEGGEPLALINRPDLGKSYLLDLRRKLYVETDLNQTPPAKNANATKSPTNSDNGDSSANPMTSESIEDNFEEAPTVIETRALPAETIAGERCAVTERRATFADGHHEVLKVFRAERLGGLAVKTEAETISQNHRVKITTERRDISLNISPEEFNIPADFKKVQSLERTRE